MPLKPAVGNMYNWVTHTHSHLAGQCPHKCSYCYVQNSRFPMLRYQGGIRILQSEITVNYGSGKTIFIEHMNDMFAEQVDSNFILQIIKHCLKYPENKYVFQSKNSARMAKNLLGIMNNMLGTTIETNYDTKLISNAPPPKDRVKPMQWLKENGAKTFVTIEPIMRFELKPFVNMLVSMNPDFVNIGADSKHCGLPEPTGQEVQDLIKAIQDKGLTIKIKSNLERLLID